MPISKEQLFKEAMDLDDNARANLAGLLIESLDTEAENGIENAWLKEIEQRMESLDSGKTETVSWDTVKERLYNNVNG
ncbi:MAG TPA: addiction module protein [Thermodesulfobacteriota bacterium]|nr:addiction module protein [Thermodesulfobacteriota bacterium]